jgi:hypothetical protein
LGFHIAVGDRERINFPLSSALSPSSIVINPLVFILAPAANSIDVQIFESSLKRNLRYMRVNNLRKLAKALEDP